MKTLFWLVVLVSIVMAVLVIRHIVRKQAARQRAEEARAAELLAVVAANRPAAPPATEATPAPAPANGLVQQKLLFEAALKAGEAGEPALSLQLFERLIARFPQSGLADQARAAAQVQKDRLARTATPIQ